MVRQGIPKEVFSDNGSNFVGANSELHELFHEAHEEETQRRTKIKWSFNWCLAPHFGGAHELLIQSAKEAIYGILKNADIWDEELQTAIVVAEYLMNCRPLLPPSTDGRDDVPP